MIKQIQASNLNRRSFTHALAALTIFTGNNAVGKTTIADALKLATLGSVPGFPSTNSGVMENFASGPSLTVAIETARGSVIRTWTRSGKSAKSVTDDANDIAKEIAPAFLSGEAFLSAKPAARALMLRAAFKIDGDPKDAVLAAVTAMSGIQPSASIRGLPFDDFVTKYLEELAEAATGIRASIKRMKGTIQGLTQLDAASDATPVTVTAEELAAARDAVTKAAQALGSAEQAVRSVRKFTPCQKPEKSREEIAQEIERLQGKLSQAQVSLSSGSATANAALSEYRAALRVYDAALEAHADAQSDFDKTIAGTEIEEFPASERLAEALKASQECLDAFRKDRENLQSLHSAAALQSSLASAARGLYERLAADLEALKQGSGSGCTCKTCGAEKAHWNAEIRAAIESRIAEKESAVADAAAKLKNAEAEAAAAAAAAKTAEANAEKYFKMLAVYESATRLESNPCPKSAPIEPAPFDCEALQDEVNSMECEFSDLKDMSAEWDAFDNFQIGSKELEEAQQALANAQSVHAGATAVAADFQAAFDASASARASEQKAAEAAAELDKAEKDLDANEATAAAVKDSAAKESEKTLAPLIQIVNRFTQGILSPGLANVGLEIGRWHGAQWQPIGRLSGAEKAMVVAALSAALATTGSKIVLIDEFSIIDDEWKPKFLANLREAQERGEIEQAIILDNRPVEADGWTTIKLTK